MTDKKFSIYCLLAPSSDQIYELQDKRPQT